jgi:hypothetical protein
MTDTPRHLAVIDERPALADLGTQIANPVRATVRTVVQFLFGAVPVLNIAAGIAIVVLREQNDLVVPGWVFLVLNGILAVTALLIALVARLMANPIVNAWITRYASWLAPLKRA